MTFTYGVRSIDFFVTGALSEDQAEIAVWRYIEREGDYEWMEELANEWTPRVAFYGYSAASRVRVEPR